MCIIIVDPTKSANQENGLSGGKNKIFLGQIVDDEVNGHTMEGPVHPPSPFLIIANKISKGPVILNVGGKRHEVRT